MKKLKKVMSLLLVSVIAVISLFCGAVTSGAQANPNFKVDGFYNTEGLYCVRLDGISKKEINLFYGNIGETFAGIAQISFDGSYFIVLWNKDSGSIKVTTASAYFNNKLVDIYGARLYDNTSAGGNYGVVFFISPTQNGGDKIISEIQRYSKVSAGFGLACIADSELVTLGLYDDANTYASFNIPATWDNTKPSDSKDISALTISKISNQLYTGKEIKPSVTVKDGNKTLKKGTDYTVLYENNIDIGTATVTIFDDNELYTGEKDITFDIVPPKTTLTAKKSGNKYKLSWKAVKGGITKYQIQYSTDGGKNYKSAGTVSASKTSSTLKLDTSKSYTFRIRSYKTVGGKKYYSSWSKTVSA